MHYHLEIIMPPVEDIQKAVSDILEPWNETIEDSRYGFFDWFVIGGRWAGEKQLSQYDPQLIEAFDQWCRDENLTVSGFRAGKQTIDPPSQIPKVDAKWQEMFGEDGPCPLFSHSNDQYREYLPGDIMTLGEVKKKCSNLKCSHVIFAAPGYVHKENNETPWTGPMEANWQITESIYNGCNSVKIQWDSLVMTALEEYQKSLGNRPTPYKENHEPQDDWLVVTVDYHS